MTRERYESISLHDLREIAKNRGMRRISTLKKADLIDAMLKKDEEEAIILRNERKQRRQMQETAPGEETAAKPVERSAAETFSAEPDVSPDTALAEEKEIGQVRGEETGSRRIHEGAEGENEDPGRQEKQADRASQESASAEENRPEGEFQEKTPAGETGQSRQRSQGQQRGRQSTGMYNAGNGRRQMNRPRRDDRAAVQNGRQVRQNRQNVSLQDRYRTSDSSQDRTRYQEMNVEREAEGGAQTEKGRPAGQVQERRAGTSQFQDRYSGRDQYREQRPDQPTGAVTAQNSVGNVSAEAEAAGGGAAVREQNAGYQYAQNARQSEPSRQGTGQVTAYQAGPQDAQQETAGARLSRFYQPGRPDTPVLHKDELNTELDSGQMANGILEVMQDGFGFIRCANYMPGENDIYVAPSQIRRFGLKTGDIIVGNIRVRTQGEKFSALLYVKSVNGFSPEEATRRYNFEDMTPVFPDERIRLERSGGSISMRIMDLISPVGKGQRGMIVSPPKAGKTTLIKDVARSVKYNNPEIHLIVLLIDERPGEVTDIREAIEGPNAEVIYSTFDELPEHHKRVSEMAIERARRLVEHKKDVMILLDSITRLTRAYNITEPSSGRTLSGGLDPAALHMPKRFFGAARNMREGGSLTILATALIDTGSKMDDIVFEEFKGTGNMEIVLDRRLSERRIFPAIDIVRSGTRRDDLLLTPDELGAMSIVRRAFNGLSAEQAVTQALDLFSRTRTNGEFVNMVRKVQWGSAPDRAQ